MLLKLKGVLIAEGFTEIIHIIDDSEDSYVNIFSTAPKDKKQAECFIEDFISAHGLKDTVTLLEPAKSWLAF